MSIQRCCPPAEVVDRPFDEPAALLKALADPCRLKILATLAAASDDVCVCDFTAGLPLNQPTVSHHLRILRDAELVQSQRRGTWVYYRLTPGAQARIEFALRDVFEQKVPA